MGSKDCAVDIALMLRTMPKCGLSNEAGPSVKPAYVWPRACRPTTAINVEVARELKLQPCWMAKHHSGSRRLEAVLLFQAVVALTIFVSSFVLCFFVFLYVSQTSHYSANQTLKTSTIPNHSAPVCLPSMLEVKKNNLNKNSIIWQDNHIEPVDNKDSKINLLI